MASSAKEVVDKEIRKLLDSYAALEEEKQRHARAALSQQHLGAIMDWLKKQDAEMANALAPQKPPSKPLKPDQWEHVFNPIKSNGAGAMTHALQKQGLSQFVNSCLVNGLVKAQHQDGEMRFDRRHHVFILHQPEGLSTEEAVRQAPLRVFAEQIITDVVDVVSGPLDQEFNPPPGASAVQLADLALARLEEASLRQKWRTSARRGLPVIAQVSPDIASVIFYGCNENADKVIYHLDSEKCFITPSIPDISQKAQEKNNFIIGTKFCAINVVVDTHLQNWQARALFSLNDPEMVMPIIDKNFI